MPTYVLFMVVMTFPFPPFANGLETLVQVSSLLKTHLNLVDLGLQVVQGWLKKSNK